jgi:hypothetical protein
VFYGRAGFLAASSKSVCKRLELSSRNSSKLPQLVFDAGTGFFLYPVAIGVFKKVIPGFYGQVHIRLVDILYFFFREIITGKRKNEGQLNKSPAAKSLEVICFFMDHIVLGPLI